MLRVTIGRGRAVGARLWAQNGVVQQQQQGVRVFSSERIGRLNLEGDLTLQQSRTWDEGVASKFQASPLSEIFKVVSLYDDEQDETYKTQQGPRNVAWGSGIIRIFQGLCGKDHKVWDVCHIYPLKEHLHTSNQLYRDKKVVIFGLPGAYTGVCSQQHVPSYVKFADKLKGKGVDKIICVSVNDPYVINAWADGLKAKEQVEFYGDFDGSFHKHLNLGFDLSAALLGKRSHRWSAYIVNGQIKVLNVEAAPSDFIVSDAETILKSIK